MSDKIVLDSPALSYINTGTGKLHVQEKYYIRALCGQPIHSGAETHMSRQVSEEHLCQRCLGTLGRKPYNGLWHRESAGKL